MDFLRSGGQSRSAQYTALDSNDQQLMSRNEQVCVVLRRRRVSERDRVECNTQLFFCGLGVGGKGAVELGAPFG